jgi:hypothetical protein
VTPPHLLPSLLFAPVSHVSCMHDVRRFEQRMPLPFMHPQAAACCRGPTGSCTQSPEPSSSLSMTLHALKPCMRVICSTSSPERQSAAARDPPQPPPHCPQDAWKPLPSLPAAFMWHVMTQRRFKSWCRLTVHVLPSTCMSLVCMGCRCTSSHWCCPPHAVG